MNMNKYMDEKLFEYRELDEIDLWDGGRMVSDRPMYSYVLAAIEMFRTVWDAHKDEIIKGRGLIIEAYSSMSNYCSPDEALDDYTFNYMRKHADWQTVKKLTDEEISKCLADNEKIVKRYKKMYEETSRTYDPREVDKEIRCDYLYEFVAHFGCNAPGEECDEYRDLFKDIENEIDSGYNKNKRLMNEKEIKRIVTEVMDAAMPTLAEAIAQAVIKYSNASKGAPKATNDVATPAPTGESQEGVCVFQYTSKCVAVIGFPKSDNARIKAVDNCFKFSPLKAYGDGTTKGWLFKKSTPADVMKLLKSWGYEVSLGASTVEKYEAMKAAESSIPVSHVEETDDVEDAEVVEEVVDEVVQAVKISAPVEDCPTEESEAPQSVVLPLVAADFNVSTFSGKVCLMDGSWLDDVEVSQIPTLHEAYHCEIKGKSVVLIHVGNNHFMQVGMGVTTDGKPLAQGGVLKTHELVKNLAVKGYYKAYLDGDVKVLKPYICDVYRKVGRADIADYLTAKVAG